MAKDKKKKKGKKKDEASSKRGSPGAAERLKAITENPIVSEVVTAALIAAAAALKDSKKTRQLADRAGDEMSALGKAGAEQGTMLKQLAVEVARRTLDGVLGQGAAKPTVGDKAKPRARKKSSPKVD